MASSTDRGDSQEIASAKQRRFEEIQAQSKRELEQLREDPELHGLLDAYAKDFGEGDPSWWKPEFELDDPTQSERIEHLVASVPEQVRNLSESIAKVIISRPDEAIERLSDETGIGFDDLRALGGKFVGAQPLRRSQTALQVARHVHATHMACAKYGLDRAEFEKLAAGPADRKAATIVGKPRAGVLANYEVAPEGITGTARLATPAQVNEYIAEKELRDDAPLEPVSTYPTTAERRTTIPGVRRSRRIWLGAGALVALGVAIMILQGNCGAETSRQVEQATTSAPERTATVVPSAAQGVSTSGASSTHAPASVQPSVMRPPAPSPQASPATQSGPATQPSAQPAAPTAPTTQPAAPPPPTPSPPTGPTTTPPPIPFN